MKRLVVNADDFGFTGDVNTGILEAHLEGILTATTLMANAPAFDHAVHLAQAHPTLDVGVHLQMVQGPSLSRPGRPLPATLPALVAGLLSGAWNVLDEFRAQTEKVLSAGLAPTHLDTHKHTHLLPPVLDAAARVAQEYKIGFLRRPFDLPFDARPVPVGARLASFAMRRMNRHFTRVLSGHGVRSTDHFAGFVLTGYFTAVDLVAVLQSLPDGITEFMCHPGHLGPELRAAPTRLKESRLQELRALTDPSVRASLNRAGIRLVSYRELLNEG